MNNKLIILLFSLVILNFTSSAPSPTKTIINDKLDEVIFEVIRNNRNEIEPVHLPNHSSHSSFLNSEVSFYEIFMNGLTTIRRTGETTVKQTGPHGDLLISGKLALGVLTFDMKTKINIMIFDKIYNLIGRIVHLDLDMAILYTKKSDSFKLMLLEVNEMDGLELKLKRSSLKNRFVNMIIGTTISSFETIAKLSIENKLSEILNETINRSRILRKLVQDL